MTPTPVIGGAAIPVEVGLDLDPTEVPLVLARLQRSHPVGTVVSVRAHDADRSRWPSTRLADVLEGAGFDVVRPPTRRAGAVHARAVRARTLADTVGPGMRLLVAGLNPSLYSADAGTAFARGGNRFWPAAVAAGLATVDRDPLDALAHHGLGMTDVVKRASARADALTTDEYRSGLGRLERLAAWLAPGAVCFVGLAGWRAAADRTAQPGLQPAGLGGVAVYVMPSTSGVNGHSSLASLTDHLAAAADLADRQRAARQRADSRSLRTAGDADDG